MTGRRIACLMLPRFAMERWQRHLHRTGTPPPDDAPHALTREGPHGPVIHATNAAAEAGGVAVGARVVDSRALCPELKVSDADPTGDLRALTQLGHWARRWCPWVAVDGSDGLVLDTTGSAHLWGGEDGLARDITDKLGKAGFTARVAIAPSWGAAWALSRYGGAAQAICPEDALQTQLAPLPVAALRLDADTRLVLRRLGLKTIGSLLDIPRPALTRRFSRHDKGANPLGRLDQALGHTPEPVNSLEDPVAFGATARLPEPVQDPTPHLPGLAAELGRALEAQGHGARRIRLLVYRVDGQVSAVHATTSSPTRDPAHMVWLLRDKVEQINPEYGFDTIVLEALVSEAVPVQQPGFDTRTDPDLALNTLVDRLSARLGPHAVLRPVARDSHIPERAEAWVSALAHGDVPEVQAPDTVRRRRMRPARVLDSPEEIKVLYAVPDGPPAQFLWRRQTHRVVRYEGPERIAPEWWHDRANTRLRDYYRIEVADGPRYWIYREGVLGDGRGETPRWFLQGFFA